MDSRELDALVAERVMGLNLKPSRELALARVGETFIAMTGNPFVLRDGRQVYMISPLPDPPDPKDWNSRYYQRVGEFMGDEIAALVDAYRLPPSPYSTSGDGMLAVMEAMRAKGWGYRITATRNGGTVHVWFAEFPQSWDDVTPASGPSAPRAVAIAALRALGVEVPGGGA